MHAIASPLNCTHIASQSIDGRQVGLHRARGAGGTARLPIGSRGLSPTSVS
jgi:hypothetical protein